MEYWFTEEQWQDFIRRREEAEKAFLSNLCQCVSIAIDNNMMRLDIWHKNMNHPYKDDEDSVLKDGVTFCDGEYGSIGNPIRFCPWCGVKLPDIPKMYIGR